MESLFTKLINLQEQEQFQTAFKNNKVFCIHNLNETVESFKKINFLESFDKLFSNWKLDVDVHLPEARDEKTTLKTSCSADAKPMFESGHSLLFNDVNRHAPILNDWLEEIRENLKLSLHTFSRCLVYATPKDGGNAAHFDQNINFVLQIHGEKTWWTAPNTSVSNPIHRHVIGHETDPELESYSEPMPYDFPKEDAQEHHLKAGSLLFVPPGVWHKTKASRDAISLNFTFSPPTWTDLVTIALRGRLMQAEIWRETAKDLQKPEQIDKFNFLLEHLASDISTWSGEDLLNALEG